ncbi:hypothetical protein Q3C87_13030, partial [Enterococcus faecium]|nr:hypothetical protein [Enterococcus faecium]
MKKIYITIVTMVLVVAGIISFVNNQSEGTNKAEEKGKISVVTTNSILEDIGMATVFLTNFIRCRTSFRMLFRLSL